MVPQARTVTPSVIGHTEPRLWTPPLRELTPETSYGFDLIDFARDVCGVEFDPWQKWAAIHMGELLPDGRPRFRIVLILVARQNGKTELAKVLVLFWLFYEMVDLVLGTSTDRSYAKSTWMEIGDMAMQNKWLAAKLGPDPRRLQMSEEVFTTLAGSEYRFAANNGRAGRSRTVHRWLLDELREHKNKDTWNAAYNAMNAVADAQVVAISNQGDDTARLLDELRNAALAYINTGQGDERLGLFEWSAPPGSDPTDPEALATANPALNLPRPYAVQLDNLIGSAQQAKTVGGKSMADFRTEVMCMRVDLLDPAIDPDLWNACSTSAPIDLSLHRDKVALCLDVSMDTSHASLVAAAVIDGQVHIDVVKAWSGFGCTKAVRAELPAIVAKIKPRVVTWMPSGPTAAVAADMNQRRAGWPRSVPLETLTAETTAACMGLAELVKVGEVVHAADPMLDAHVGSAQRLPRGDGWVFQRKNTGPIDGAYAVAGAVHAARTLPPAPPPLSGA